MRRHLRGDRSNLQTILLDRYFGADNLDTVFFAGYGFINVIAAAAATHCVFLSVADGNGLSAVGRVSPLQPTATKAHRDKVNNLNKVR